MDFSSYLSTLKNLEIKNIIILIITVIIFLIAFIIFRFYQNNFCRYMLKISIVCLILCSVFFIPQSIAIAIDLSKESIVYEENASYNISNNSSTVNGFDFFSDYNIVKSKEGDKILIITNIKKLPDGEGTTNILYAKHSRILLEYRN